MFDCVNQSATGYPGDMVHTHGTTVTLHDPPLCTDSARALPSAETAVRDFACHETVAPCAGDILSLVEKAESNIKAGEAEAMTQRLMAAKFDLNDFLSQYKMINNMGSMGSVIKMLPGEYRMTLPSNVRRNPVGHDDPVDASDASRYAPKEGAPSSR